MPTSTALISRTLPAGNGRNRYPDLEVEPGRAERPDWNLFRDGCSGGETPQQVSARADRVVNRVRAIRGDVLVFTSGHFMRVLASRWLGLEPTANTVDILC
jgi:probable phosphoglycerate mutase